VNVRAGVTNLFYKRTSFCSIFVTSGSRSDGSSFRSVMVARSSPAAIYYLLFIKTRVKYEADDYVER